MTEKLTMAYLETLLESMEPAEIRERFSDELRENPSCEAMLSAFESMETDLLDLKSLDQPPHFRKPGIMAHRLKIWSLPLAAVLLLGLLWGYRFMQQESLTLNPEADRVAVQPETSDSVADDALVLEDRGMERGFAEVAESPEPAKAEAIRPIDSVEKKEGAAEIAESKDKEFRSVARQEAERDDAPKALAVEQSVAVDLPQPKRATAAPSPVVEPNVPIDEDFANEAIAETAASAPPVLEEEVSMERDALPLERKEARKSNGESGAIAGLKSKKNLAKALLNPGDAWLSSFASAWNGGKSFPNHLFAQDAASDWSLLGESADTLAALEQGWNEMMGDDKNGTLSFGSAREIDGWWVATWRGKGSGSLKLRLDSEGRCVSILQNP